MELRRIIKPPKIFGGDNEPTANVLRQLRPKPSSKPFNPDLPPAPFPSWDPNGDHGISSAAHPDEGQHVQPKNYVDHFAQTTLSFSVGISGSSAQNSMSQMPGTDGIYISTPRDVLTFYRLMDDWVRAKDSQERQSLPYSDHSTQTELYYNEANQPQERPINENGALLSEITNEFKLLHPTFRSTIIRAVIEREGISEDDIEQELATPLPYWLGIDENSVKCVLHDYMIMSREPTFEGPNDHDFKEALSFMHHASLPLPLLYPWTDFEATLNNADGLDNDYATDQGAASNIYNTFDYGDPSDNGYFYDHPNIKSFDGGYQCNPPIQPIIDLQDPSFTSDQGCYNDCLSQPEDLLAQPGLYGGDYFNNVRTGETALSCLPDAYAASAVLTFDQQPSSINLQAPDVAMSAMSAGPPVKVCPKASQCSPTPLPSTSWADNNLPTQGMSVPYYMRKGQYGDIHGHQYNHGFYHNYNYSYDTGATAAGPSSASADKTFVTSTTTVEKTQAKNKDKGKAKLSNTAITANNSNTKSTGDACYAGLPRSYTFNSLESTMPSPAQPMVATMQSGLRHGVGPPEPPKRKRGRPRKEVSVVVDANGTASVLTTGGGRRRAGPSGEGPKTKRAKKNANNQQMAAPTVSSKSGEGFTDMSFVKKN